MDSGTRTYTEALRDLRRAFDADVLPHRARLFAYCLHLTRDGLLAEDLHQETMLKAFALVTERFERIEHPRAWLFRVATRTWLDWRRKRTELLVDELPELTSDDGPDGDGDSAPTTLREIEQALEPLLRTLPPRELAALLLRDLYGFSGAEAAAILGASEAAVKMAVVRGRRRARAIRAPDVPSTVDDRAVAPALLQAFVAAFVARDTAALTRIIHEHASARAIGCATEAGRDEILRGTLRYALARTDIARCGLVLYRGRWLVAVWYRADDAGADGAPADGAPVDAVSDLMSVVSSEGRIAEITLRWFSPDLIAHVCGELGLPYRTHGYGPPDGARWWNVADDG